MARITVLGPTHPIKGGISHYSTILVRELRKKHDVRFISYKFQYPNFLYPAPGRRMRNPVASSLKTSRSSIR